MSQSAENDAPCPDCEHVHTPEGCTGPPSPSDVWAGVSPVVCDCGVWDNESRVTPPGEEDA
jgi:hypothetical protein